MLEKISTKIALFRGIKIRKTLHNNEWWFVVNDVVKALTDTPNIADYIKKFRHRDKELNKGWGQIVTPLSVSTAGGPQMLNCANTEFSSCAGRVSSHSTLPRDCHVVRQLEIKN